MSLHRPLGLLQLVIPCPEKTAMSVQIHPKAQLRYKDTNRIVDDDTKLNHKKAIFSSSSVAKIVKETSNPQESKTCESFSQTVVTVNRTAPQLTVSDLTSMVVSANYWRSLADKIESDLDFELERNFELSVRLGKINEEVAIIKDDIQSLINLVESAVAEDSDEDEASSVVSNITTSNRSSKAE